MELFQWKEEYELGLPHIDAQHRQMVEMLNSLYAAKQSGETQPAIEKTMDGLLNYARVHFADEEAAMHQAGYPDLDKQRREHRQMTDKVLQMRSQMLQGDAPATFELLNFMCDWLKLHITGSDKQFGDFMRDEQIRAEQKPAVDPAEPQRLN